MGKEPSTIWMLSNRMLVKSEGEILSMDLLEFLVGLQSMEPGGLTKIGGEPLIEAAKRGVKVVWLGAPQTEFEQFMAEHGLLIPSNPASPETSVMMAPVNLKGQTPGLDAEDDLYELYYGEMANVIGWTTYHYDVPDLSGLVKAEIAERRVAELFVERVMKGAKSGDTVVANDYHFPAIGLVFAEAIARRNKNLPPGSELFHLDVVSLWHIPHPDPDFIAQHWPRDFAQRRFDAMPYTRWWFHSTRWADNYAACVVEFAGAYSLNLLVQGLDADARDRLIGKLTPARLTRLCKDVESETLKQFLRTIGEEQTKTLVDKLEDGEVFMKVLSLLPNDKNRDMQSVATAHYVESETSSDFDIDQLAGSSVPEPSFGDDVVPPVSIGMFDMPGTINPSEMQQAAARPEIEAKMAELDAQITELNGGEKFNGLEIFWLARQGDRKNAADLFCKAVLQVADEYARDGEGPIVVYLGGARARKGVDPHDRQWALESKLFPLLKQHSNILLIDNNGRDQVGLTAERRRCNLVVSGGRVGGRDVAGAEPFCTKLEGDPAAMLIQMEGAAFAETAEGVNGDQSPFVEGHGPLKGAVMVDLGPDIELPPGLETSDPKLKVERQDEIAVQNLARAIKDVDNIRRNDPKQFDHRYQVTRAATLHTENGKAWFAYTIAQARGHVLKVIGVTGSPLSKLVSCAVRAAKGGVAIPAQPAKVLADLGLLPPSAAVLAPDGRSITAPDGVTVPVAEFYASAPPTIQTSSGIASPRSAEQSACTLS